LYVHKNIWGTFTELSYPLSFADDSIAKTNYREQALFRRRFIGLAKQSDFLAINELKLSLSN